MNFICSPKEVEKAAKEKREGKLNAQRKLVNEAIKSQMVNDGKEVCVIYDEYIDDSVIKEIEEMGWVVKKCDGGGRHEFFIEIKYPKKELQG